MLDPVALLASKGEGALRQQLSALMLNQLPDAVAKYRMDPGKDVMKWKNRMRVIDRILELALGRAKEPRFQVGM